MMRFTEKKLATYRFGFSLIEMMVYMALLMVISVSAVLLLLSMQDLLGDYEAKKKLTESGRVAMERILYDIRSADQVDTADPETVLTSSPGHIVLTKGATTTEFLISDGALVLEINDAEVGPLTYSDVSVDELRFFHYSNSETDMVRVQFTLTTIVGFSTTTQTFNSGAVVRGTYE